MYLKYFNAILYGENNHMKYLQNVTDFVIDKQFIHIVVLYWWL